LELGHLEKKSHFSDDERVSKAMAYLEESATSICPSSFKNKKVCCHCLASLSTNEDYRNAVAIHVIWWARLDKETQQDSVYILNMSIMLSIIVVIVVTKQAIRLGSLVVLAIQTKYCTALSFFLLPSSFRVIGKFGF
jgi:hypothetical protein